MSNVLVFGHQNPDNDAIMSSVVLSQLLNQVEFGGNTYQACCLGPLPAEFAKLLEDVGVPAPTLIDAIEPVAEGAEAQLVVLRSQRARAVHRWPRERRDRRCGRPPSLR